jgi:hypothetical protein
VRGRRYGVDVAVETCAATGTPHVVPIAPLATG